jgi:hypothetical protein
MEGIMSRDAKTDPATERVLASIDDEVLAARYPNRTHFISADNPNQGEMATRALFDGDPVVIVYADGHELLVRPEEVHGPARWSLAVTALLLRFRRRNHDAVQFPPRARIEARDSTGHPIAA